MKTPILFVLALLFSTPAFALHVYADYDCQSEKLVLKYDGPGSNYAIGGLSNFYLKIGQNELGERVLAEQYEEGSSKSRLSEDYDGQKLEIYFETTTSTRLSQEEKSLKPGDECKADNDDYQTSNWSSQRTIKIKNITRNAAKKLGIRRGQKINFVCSESRSVPIKCPSTGRYGADDLAD